MKINNSNKIALLISVYVFFRIFNANSLIFSYDFINYLDYFDKIMVMDWNEFYENLNMRFPFVLIDFKLFEFLFVFIVKILLIFFNSKISYALLASVSVYYRTKILESYGLNIYLIILIQVLTINLMEANALRSGIALTFSLYYIRNYLNFSYLKNLSIFFISIFFHVQASIILIPFLISSLIYKFIRFDQKLKLYFKIISIIILIFALLITNSLKDSDLVQAFSFESDAYGFNVVTFLGMFIIFFCLIPNKREKILEYSYHHKKIISLLIFSFSLSLLLFFGKNFVLISDRLWQYSIIVFVCVYNLNNLKNKLKNFPVNAALILILIWMNINTLIRYPVSNMFYLPPFERNIEPLFLLESVF